MNEWIHIWAGTENSWHVKSNDVIAYEYGLDGGSRVLVLHLSTGKTMVIRDVTLDVLHKINKKFGADKSRELT